MPQTFSSDLYNVLEVSPLADAEQIKASYRRLVRLHHPDAHPTRRAQCEALIKEIIEAYAILSDEDKRRHYDHERKMDALNGRRAATGEWGEPAALVGKVRFVLGIAPHEFAAKIGFSDAALGELEARDALPSAPVQLRTFVHFCDLARQKLEGEGQFARADEMRQLLERKRNQRRLFG